MLPVALELASEVVWEVCGPETTSGVLYMLGNGECGCLSGEMRHGAYMRNTQGGVW